MKKFIRTFISLILVLVLFVLAMPIYALEEVTVKEIEDLREENVKHFDMGDGTYKAVVYSEPVHRKDSEGKWTDIDNTLSEVKENGMTNYATSDGRVKFTKNLNNGKIFELKENGYKISFSLLDKDIKEAKANIDNHKTKKSTSVLDSNEKRFEKLKSVDNLTKVRYNDIKKNIDIEYEIYSNNIKESIIVNGKQDAYEYTFELELNKLIAILNDDGSISLTDEETGEEKYVMPSPFMFDDKGELSTDVYYTLIATGRYKYQLKVIASNEWINAEGRDFPVTIDPSIEVDTSYGEAYVSSTNPNTNYKKPSDGRLFVSSTQRTFLKFNLPTIPEDYRVTEAYLITHFYFYASNYGNMSIEAYTVPYSWNENTITWNNSVASHQLADGSADILSTNHISSSITATESLPVILPFEVTEAVQDWCLGEENNGIALRRVTGMTNAIAFTGYNSTSNAGPGPTLEISYQHTLNGTFYMRNAELNTYIENGTSGLSLQPFDGQAKQKWQITHLGNGYYKIISVDSGLALTAPSSANGNITLGQYTGSDNQKWEISKFLNAYYKISPKSNPSYDMCVNETSNATNVQIKFPQSDNNYDEWIFYQVSTNHDFEMQGNSNWCWVACIRALSSVYLDSMPTQQDIVVGVMESLNMNNSAGINISYTDEKGEAAFRYIFGETSIYKLDKENCSWEIIKSLIDSGTYIIASIKGEQHEVLIYDYVEYNNGENDEDRILYVFDPNDFDKFPISENEDISIYPAQNYYTIQYGPFTSGMGRIIAIYNPEIN